MSHTSRKNLPPDQTDNHDFRPDRHSQPGISNTVFSSSDGDDSLHGSNHIDGSAGDDILIAAGQQTQHILDQFSNADLRSASSAEHDDFYSNDNRTNTIDGSDGDDWLHGGSQSDVIGSDSASIGADTDDQGNKHINGGAGDDILIAAGQQTLGFHDRFSSDTSFRLALSADAKYAEVLDIMNSTVSNTGGTARTVFELHSGSGNDTILNFHTDTDRLQIDRYINNSDIQDLASLIRHIHLSGDTISLELGQGNSVTLVGVDIGHFSADNLLLA